MGKKKWLCWLAGAVCLVLLCSLAVYEWTLDNRQAAALAELDRREGEYDAQSIVLTGTSETRARELAQLLDAKLRITSDGSFATLTLPEGVTIRDVYARRSVRALLDELSVDYEATISSEQEVIPQRPSYPVSDPGFAQQGYLDYLNLGSCWSYGQGEGVLVAVIDTGIDTDHPDFAGRISEYSYNATEDKVVKDYDMSIIEDQQGHGTAVAGVLGAAIDGSGTVGVAPGVTLLVIKAECDEFGKFKRTSDLVFGLYYAIEQYAGVVNMSFGVYGANPFADATALARDSDILCVAAAGNDAVPSLSYPAADPNVFGVGALAENSWELAEYSNYGDNVDLVAPGSTYTTLIGGDYGYMTGTSMASPAVAGVLALYRSQIGYFSWEEMAELVYAAGRDLGDLGPDWLYGYGAVDTNALCREEKGSITFVMQSEEVEDLQQVFVREHTLQNIPEPERLYAVFDGWYYDPQCTDEYQWYEDVFSADLKLYAKWANEDDSVPYTYVTLDDGTVEIRSYTGHRRYITVPDSIDGKTVSAIGMGAFSGESRLRRVNLPRNLKVIGSEAFSGCTNLTSIEIPDSVKSIGDYAFYANSRLYSVALGSGVESIGSYAFAGCGMLTRFHIPKNVSQLDGTAFFGAVSLENITVDSANTAFVVAKGALMDSARTKLVVYPAGMKETYTVPDSVTTIGPAAFAYSGAQVNLNKAQRMEAEAFAFSTMSGITLPDTLTYMGPKAFFGSSIGSVGIGSGLTSISAEAFRYCGQLRHVTIPAGVAEIKGAAFYMCGALETLEFEAGSKLETIDVNAFDGAGLKSLALPASVKVIGSQAFNQNTRLQALKFADGSALTAIGAEAFADSAALQSVTLPDSLRELGDYAFRGSGLTEIFLPASVQTLGANPFAACHSLTAIAVDGANPNFTSREGILYDASGENLLAFPAGSAFTALWVPETVKTVGVGAVYGAHELQMVDLPASVQTVSEYAFYDCRNVNQYQVNEGLTFIGSYAFAENTYLWDFYVPASVSQISRFAFAGNRNMYTVNIAEGSAMTRLGYGAFAHSGIMSFRVPASVTTMAQGVFEGCSNLYDVTFAENSLLTSIAAYTFDGCGNLNSIVFAPGSLLTSIAAHGLDGLRNLRTLEFGDAKLTQIGNYALRFCENLTDVTLPETLKSIGRFAFYGCEKLEGVNLPAGVEHLGSFAFYDTGATLYFASNELPEVLDENWDEGLDAYFAGVSEVLQEGDWEYAVLTGGDISLIQYLGSAQEVDLTALNLGGDIVSLGGYAFYESGVTRVVLPDTLTEIQSHAFAGSALTEVKIPASVTFVGRNAFADTPIASVTFAPGSHLATIEQEAFANTKKLTSVTLPKSLTKLGARAFFGSGLNSLSFETGIALTEIPKQAFSGSALTAVTIPDCVTTIAGSAFRDCVKLQSVTLGAGEGLYIADYVFYNTALSNVNIPTNVSYIGEYAFVGLTELESFTVSANNPHYKAVDGLLMNKDGRKLIAVPAARTGSLSVPATVEEIGFGAFENSSLSSVSFHPDSNILTIGYRAFFGAEKLTSIAIPASVVSIDYYAFANCSALETVTFAEGNRLMGIYEGAFSGCTKLKNITIPDSIVEISEFAFYDCASLTGIPVSESSTLLGIYDYAFAYAGMETLAIPKTTLDIGEYAFMGIPATTITVPGDNSEQLVIGIGAFADCGELEHISLPFLGATNGDEDITWFAYVFGAGSYEAGNAYVPESLKKVTLTGDTDTLGVGAFYGLEHLERIELPDTVCHLERACLEGTPAVYELKHALYLDDDDYGNMIGKGLSGKLTIAEGAKILNNGMFSGCTLLEEVVLPDSLKEIDGNVFEGCTGLKTIRLQEGLTRLGDFAFSGCISLRSVTLPASVTQMGMNLFNGCSALETVVLPENLQVIPNSMFMNCIALTSVVIPDGVHTIESYAFVQCDNLAQVTLGSGVTSIGDGAFMNDSSLTVIYNNSSLTLTPGSDAYGQIALNAKLVVDKNGNQIYGEGVEEYAIVETGDGFRFRYEDGAYTLLEYFGTEDTVTLPLQINGCDYEIYRFRGARNVILPEGFTHIGEEAFSAIMEQESTLESIVIPDTVTTIGAAAFYRTKLQEVWIPDSVTAIGVNVFGDCYGLTSARLPEGLGTIEGSLFSGCKSLETIQIPESVSMIFYNSFYGCTSLNDVTIPANVYYMDGSVFSGCTSLTKLTLAEGNENFTFVDGLLYTADLSQLVYVPAGIGGDVKLAEGLQSIGSSAFMGNTAITSVTVPSGVTYIGSSAFEGCTALKTVTLPDTVEQIDWRAFYGCTALENVRLSEKLTCLNSSLFEGCTSLKAIVIPDSVTELQNAVFSGCTALTDVKLPASLQTIWQYAFTKCTALESIVIPEGTTYIDSYCFEYCENLKSVTLPDSVEYIGDSAFYYSGLESFTVPPKVTAIAPNLLGFCHKLETVELHDNITQIGDYAFYQSRSLRRVEIPDSVTYLGTEAFQFCGGLQSVKIGSGITQISPMAFDGCASLIEVTFGENVAEIAENAFNGCDKLRIVYNNSALDITPGSEASGCVARNAKVVYDASGTPRYLDGWEGYAFIDTEDGWRFARENGGYVLLGYYGNEENLTLPASFRGESYTVASLGGMKHIVVPEGVKAIDHMAGMENGYIESAVVGKNVAVGSMAFNGCGNLEKAVLGEGVTVMSNAFSFCTKLTDVTLDANMGEIGQDVFLVTPIYDDPANRQNGVFMLGKHLIEIGENAKFNDWAWDAQAASDAFREAYLLKQSTVGGERYYSLDGANNLETMIVLDSGIGTFGGYFYSVPMTLKQVVLRRDVEITTQYAFADMENIAIFVEEDRKAVAHWDNMYPGWNNGNKVYYGDQWITVCFYDAEGELLSREFLLTSQVIRRPHYTAQEGVTFLGWDLDGDGTPDRIPATSASDIHAYPVLEEEAPEPEFTMGDVNHDGYVDGADAMLLRQFVARWKLETFYAENADIDGSGVIDGADAMLLRQRIAG